MLFVTTLVVDRCINCNVPSVNSIEKLLVKRIVL